MRKNRSSRGFCVILAVCTAFAAFADGDLIGYVSQGPVLYLTNFDTGTQTPVPLANLSSNIAYFESLAVSPDYDYLYAIGHWRTYLTVQGRQYKRALYRIDLGTGNVSLVSSLQGQMGGFENTTYFPDMAVDVAGTPYTVDKGLLYTLVPDGGWSVTYVGQTHGPPDGYGIGDPRAFDIDLNGVGLAQSTQTGNMLYRVNLSNALVTQLGSLPQSFVAFDHGPDGTVYGWSGKTIYRVDVGGLSVSEMLSVQYGGNAFSLIPEPTTLTFFTLCIPALIRRTRRRFSIDSRHRNQVLIADEGLSVAP